MREYEEWCEEKGYKPVFAVLMGSKLFGTDTKRSDEDWQCVHVQPIEDYVGLHLNPKESFNFKIGEKDFQSFDIRKYFYLVWKGNFQKTTMCWIPPVIYDQELYKEIKYLVRKLIPKEIFYSVKGMMVKNYAKFFERRENKDHFLPKKMLHIISIGKAYVKFLNNYQKDFINFQIDGVEPLIEKKRQQEDFCDSEEKTWTKYYKKFLKDLELFDFLWNKFPKRSNKYVENLTTFILMARK